MIRRALMLGIAAVFVLAAPAVAQYAGPEVAGSVLADGNIQITGDGCPPNSTINYTVTKDGEPAGSGTATADSTGAFSFVVETSGPGEYAVTVECGGETTVFTATVGGGDVPRGEAAAPGGALPTTGSNSSLPLTQLGAILVGTGALAVYVARRRRASAFAA